MFVIIGTRDMTNVLKKLGLVTNSSAETEIPSIVKRFPKHAWFIYFKIAQGEDERKEDMLLQDNESRILIHKNYPLSTRKGSKCARVGCIFVADETDKKEVKVLYCLKENMVACYSTKPFQDRFFEF